MSLIEVLISTGIIYYEKKLFIIKPLKAFKRIEDKFDLNLIFAPVKKDKTEDYKH